MFMGAFKARMMTKTSNAYLVALERLPKISFYIVENLKSIIKWYSHN